MTYTKETKALLVAIQKNIEEVYESNFVGLNKTIGLANVNFEEELEQLNEMLKED